VFRSLRTRLLLTYLLVGGLVLALVGLSLLVFMLRNPYAAQLTYQRLEGVAETISQRERFLPLLMRPQALQELLQRTDQAIGVRLLVLDASGTLLADSRPDAAHFTTSDLQAASAHTENFHQEFRDATNRRWLVAGHILSDESVLLATLPRPTLRSLQVLREEFLPALLQAAGVALLVSLLAAWLISRWVAKPLQHISQAARAVAQGDYSQQPVATGPKEVQSVALAFGEMMARVQSGQQSQRDFVANVSHELKTPLTSIQGFAQAILDGTASDEPAKRHAAQIIYDETERLRRLVEDLLDLARLDAGQVAFKRQALDLDALLSAVSEKLAPAAAAKEVHFDIALPPLPTIVGDADRLAQVFTNLLDNAIKHSPKGGTVGLHGEVDPTHVFIHVDDTGPGIPTEELSRIFERFYQLDKSRSGGRARGVGLGLSISREIVHAHGGRLIARSKVGAGSRFSVELPIIRHDDVTIVGSSVSDQGQ
jgi:signal transduction histidine kinase